MAHWYVICFRIRRSPVQTSIKTKKIMLVPNTWNYIWEAQKIFFQTSNVDKSSLFPICSLVLAKNLSILCTFLTRQKLYFLIKFYFPEIFRCCSSVFMILDHFIHPLNDRPNRYVCFRDSNPQSFFPLVI